MKTLNITKDFINIYFICGFFRYSTESSKMTKKITCNITKKNGMCETYIFDNNLEYCLKDVVLIDILSVTDKYNNSVVLWENYFNCMLYEETDNYNPKFIREKYIFPMSIDVSFENNITNLSTGLVQNPSIAICKGVEIYKTFQFLKSDFDELGMVDFFDILSFSFTFNLLGYQMQNNIYIKTLLIHYYEVVNMYPDIVNMDCLSVLAQFHNKSGATLSAYLNYGYINGVVSLV